MFGLDLGQLVVHLRANTAQFQAAMHNARYTMQETAAAATTLGAGMTKGITLPASAIGGLGVKSLADFEEAMVEVQKVTNETTAAKLNEQIKAMSMHIPLARTELAGLAADAARFGIQGTANIAQFTDTVAKMSVATELSAQEAGVSLAKITTLTKTPVAQAENLGSAINALSNTFATSSAEIVNSMTRSGGALSQFGLNQREIAGIGAALNEVSASSTRAGTRLRTLANIMMSPSKMGDIADALNITSEEFKTLRKESPLELFKDMTEAMGSGVDASGKLREAIGQTGTAALAPLAENLEGLNRALEISNRSFAEATSLQKEFEDAIGTVYAQLKLTRNVLENALDIVGARLTPAFRTFMETVRRVAYAFTQLNPATQNTIINMVGIAAAAGPILWIYGKLTKTMLGLGKRIKQVAAALTALRVFSISIVAPVFAIIAALYTLRAEAKQNFMGVGDMFGDTLNWMEKKFASWGDWAKGVWESFKDWSATAFNDIVNKATRTLWRLYATWEAVKTGMTGESLLDGVNKAIDKYEEMQKQVEDYAGGLHGLGATGTDYWKEELPKWKQTIKDLKLGEYFKGLGSSVADQFKKDMQNLAKFFDDRSGALKEILSDMFPKIPEAEIQKAVAEEAGKMVGITDEVKKQMQGAAGGITGAGAKSKGYTIYKEGLTAKSALDTMDMENYLQRTANNSEKQTRILQQINEDKESLK